MSTPKRHHEIPQMLLRNFVDENGLLHCYRKEDNRAFAAAPAKVFARRRLYSKRGEDCQQEDASKEQELAVQIEGPAKPVIKKIVTRARMGMVPGLSSEEKFIWDLFFCVQCRRTVSTLRDLEDSDLVQRAINDFEANAGPLSGEERAQVDGTPERQRTAVRESWIDILTLPKGDHFEALRGKGLHVLVLENPKKTLIIGDDPIIPMISPGETLNHADAANFFPIARDVAVACSGGSLDEERSVIPKSGDGTRYIRKVNRRILEQSSMVACPSRRLIESLRRHDRG